MSAVEPRPAQPQRHTDRGTGRLRVGQWLGVSTGLLLVVALVGIGLALQANSRLSDQRTLLVDRIAPAQVAALSLENALVDEETGIRGYLLTGEQRFVAPYRDGLRSEARAYSDLRDDDPGGARALAARIEAVRASAGAWRRVFAMPTLRARSATRGSPAVIAAGKARFDVVRGAVKRLKSELASRRIRARNRLFDAGRTVTRTLVLAAVLVAVGLLGAAFLLRRIVTAPLERLGRQARRVAEGEFRTPLELAGGAREIVELGADVGAMRERIVQQLADVESSRGQLQEQALELRRSNAELEQFAYVASHDLQEPLRKVASFCQALERRYGGQLDERADQYIAFAVDGAKRMQSLINDLLAFSRVGRGGRKDDPLDANELVEQARDAVSAALQDAGATVVVSELPVVRGDRTLLVSVFQNLIANAVKFRTDEPAVVQIDAERDAGAWRFSCTDNGIGIDPEYAERIFVIFQRLHPKETYAGTGIGLSMCRKIIEYHGGRIWLDGDHAGGTRICFTLPIPEEVQT